MLTLAEWRLKIQEMAGTAAIVSKGMCHNPDFQVWGAACSGKGMNSGKKHHKKKKS